MNERHEVRILALETSTRTASAALLQGDRLVADIQVPPEAGTASALAPAIKKLMREADWAMADVQLIGVSIGPGSFTGLRVGVTTAKTLAYALRCDVLGVDTLEVIAAQTPPTVKESSGEVCAVVDAQRQQVFAGRFRRMPESLGDEFRWQSVAPTAIMDNTAWLGSLQSGDCVTGLGLRKLAAKLPAGVTALPEEVWTPRAETVGRLALNAYQAGRRDDFWKLLPVYYRKSAAEEKAEQTSTTSSSSQ